MVRLTDAQAAAILAWANLHGRFWKDRLRQAWGKSFYGALRADHAPALQQLRNESANVLNSISMPAIQAQVHAYDVRVAAQNLIDKLKDGHIPGNSTSEFVRLQGLLQLSPQHYEGGQ